MKLLKDLKLDFKKIKMWDKVNKYRQTEKSQVDIYLHKIVHSSRYTILGMTGGYEIGQLVVPLKQVETSDKFEWEIDYEMLEKSIIYSDEITSLILQFGVDFVFDDVLAPKAIDVKRIKCVHDRSKYMEVISENDEYDVKLCKKFLNNVFDEKYY